MRLVHSHLDLVGLVGFTIIGTLPTFLPTIAHHRAVSGREATVASATCMLAAVTMGLGLWAGPAAVGAGTLMAGAAVAMVVGGIGIRLWKDARE